MRRKAECRSSARVSFSSMSHARLRSQSCDAIGGIFSLCILVCIPDRTLDYFRCSISTRIMLHVDQSIGDRTPEHADQSWASRNFVPNVPKSGSHDCSPAIQSRAPLVSCRFRPECRSSETVEVAIPSTSPICWWVIAFSLSSLIARAPFGSHLDIPHLCAANSHAPSDSRLVQNAFVLYDLLP
jgi:hypothetical protein